MNSSLSVTVEEIILQVKIAPGLPLNSFSVNVLSSSAQQLNEFVLKQTRIENRKYSFFIVIFKCYSRSVAHFLTFRIKSICTYHTRHHLQLADNFVQLFGVVYKQHHRSVKNSVFGINSERSDVYF